MKRPLVNVCACGCGAAVAGTFRRGHSHKSHMYGTPWERVRARCEWVGQCFVWQGPIQRHGHGRICIADRHVLVHRVAYEHLHGPIPDGLTLDHVKARGCQSNACCNVEHLEAVPHRVNVLRGIGPTAKNAQKTHCKRGHELAGANLKPSKLRLGIRECRLCANAR